MRIGADDQIEKLRQKKKDVEARIRRLQHQQTTAARKRDARRKILVGAVVLQAAMQDAAVKAWLGRLLDQSLSRERDRSLFGFGFESSPEMGGGN
ncbi:mobilization protein C [Roseomonas genomospecies 6]|uniref:Mobilization protein C n=1 Tax=Roseomonas genomospecies 6 TaxID=214106 RepID=A0A9W7NHV7_9PROT|nr:mobilization protein C [Roseomonas genomospecies 6]KAA0679169.1 mobilization protein C [Roseomonas genomospecies 6]